MFQLEKILGFRNMQEKLEKRPTLMEKYAVPRDKAKLGT